MRKNIPSKKRWGGMRSMINYKKLCDNQNFMADNKKNGDLG